MVMSLAPAEEQVLADLEAKLRWSDPRLAAKLALFSYRTGRGPAAEALSPWRGQHEQAIRWIVVLLAVVAVIVLGTALAAKTGRADRSVIQACRTGRSATRLWWPGFCRPLTCHRGQHPYPPLAGGHANCRQVVLPAGAADRE